MFAGILLPYRGGRCFNLDTGKPEEGNRMDAGERVTINVHSEVNASDL